MLPGGEARPPGAQGEVARSLPQDATFMYMKTVGVGELRQNLSTYLRRVKEGERVIVTDRNRPVAELGPLRDREAALDALIAEGKLRPAARRGVSFRPVRIDGDPHAGTRALNEARGED